MADTGKPLALLAMVGAGDSEIPVLAELHRNPQVHLVGIYDPDPEALGHEIAEILGLRHDTSKDFLRHIASAHQVILPDDRSKLSEEVAFLRAQGVSVLGPEEALERYGGVENLAGGGRRSATSRPAASAIAELEEAVRWLDRALRREEILRGLLSLVLQALDADSGSIQLLNPATRDLYIAYADGLSDHTIRSSFQKLGEGISGRVAASRKGEIIQGLPRFPEDRDRPDIQSALCVSLVQGDDVLGVLNVNRDSGDERFEQGDLATAQRMAERITPILARLLEIQRLHERALVEDLEHGLDKVNQLDDDLPHCLALVRDLLQELSGADRCSLVILTPDGPAYRLLPAAEGDMEPRSARDVDPTTGVLGQVLLTQEIVLLEERIRPAGEKSTRRHSTLYVPLGVPEPFAVIIAEFEGLSALSHFQRSLQEVQEVITPRLGALLAREETRGRMERLRRLAEGLSQLAALPIENRSREAAELLGDLTGARAVAVWMGDSLDPNSISGPDEFRDQASAGLWSALRKRLGESSSSRVREMDLNGTGLRSLLLVGSGDGPAIAAFNRNPQGPIEELGFRDEDLTAAGLILKILLADGTKSAPPLQAAEPGTEETDESTESPRAGKSDDFSTNRSLLADAVQRELVRAQRYHFGFSLTCFQIHVPQGSWPRLQSRLRSLISGAARGTDCVLWIADTRFAVLAPEESRGQRRLAGRFDNLLADFFRREMPDAEVQVRVSHGSYPRDADDAPALIQAAERGLDPDNE